MTEIEVVGEPAALGECPVWSADESCLYWVDIDGREVRRHDPVAGTDTVVSTDGRPGSIALTSRPGQLLLAMEKELVRLDFGTGTTEPWITIDETRSDNRLNDGACDPAGRFFVGSMHEDPSAGHTTGSLYRVEADGVVTVLEESIGVSNGLGFDAELGRMYFADSPTGVVRVYDYDPDSGEMRNERPFFAYGDLPGLPDGACIDESGCYWSASVFGAAVIRVTPDGRLDRRIELPVSNPTMPAFGGTGLDTLFVTSLVGNRTRPIPSDDDGVAEGSLLAIDAGVRGRTEPTFAGNWP